jgi:hypothetical protein
MPRTTKKRYAKIGKVQTVHKLKQRYRDNITGHTFYAEVDYSPQYRSKPGSSKKRSLELRKLRRL